MDIDEKYKAVDVFFKDISKNGKSNVVCPICKTALKIETNSTSYSVMCQTKNCLFETFRGI